MLLLEIGKVVGNVWATKKDDLLNGQKLLVLKILKSEQEEYGHLVVAADMIGAGKGELVLLSRGAAARCAIRNNQAPVDAAVVGIVDSIEMEE